jgi:hypothetical protein
MQSGSGKGSVRRTLLQRGAALVAGAFGLGTAADNVQAASMAHPAVLSSLTLRARRRAVSFTAGSEAAGRLLSHGDMLDESGAPVGAFYTNGFCMQTPFGSILASANLEFQTLTLADGTLFGMGAPGASVRNERHRAVLGGTGRFAGARGTYVEREGEDGSLEFVVTLSQ